ncbi:MAG: neutral zinc metallopeptidase, partial [Chloroflexota bacterium]|nr:neutral zinc metallopeptidase [Chloroflexota bacterium]
MTFNPNQPLDPGQVRDRRGLGGGAVAAGGGGIALVIALVYLLLGGSPADLAAINPGTGVTQPDNSTLQQECKTGADANKRQDCRIVGYVNSIQAFWSTEFKTLGEPYQQAATVLFTNQVSTGCGVASSQVGPFYCPPDMTIYLDLGFFEQLQTRFGARGGPFAEAYV